MVRVGLPPPWRLGLPEVLSGELLAGPGKWYRAAMRTAVSCGEKSSEELVRFLEDGYGRGYTSFTRWYGKLEGKVQ